jgi:hypothetical protein
MAVSMVKYHAATSELEQDRPVGFTTTAFRKQLRQMLGRFDIHRQWYHFDHFMDVDKPLHKMNDPIKTEDFAGLTLVSKFDAMMHSNEDYDLLLLWDKSTLPFRLVQYE